MNTNNSNSRAGQRAEKDIKDFDAEIKNLIPGVILEDHLSNDSLSVDDKYESYSDSDSDVASFDTDIADQIREEVKRRKTREALRIQELERKLLLNRKYRYNGKMKEFCKKLNNVTEERFDYIMKLLEDSSLTLYYVARARNVGDYIAAGITFLKLRLGNAIFSIEHLEFIEDAVRCWWDDDYMEYVMEEQTDAEDMAKAARQLYETVEKAKMAPLIKKFQKLVSFILTYILSVEQKVEFNKSIWSECFELHKDEIRTGQFLLHMADILTFTFERGVTAIKYKDPMILLSDPGQHKEWFDKAYSLTQFAKYLSNPDPHGFTIFTYLHDLDNVIRQGEIIAKTATSIEGTSVKRMLLSLKEIKNNQVGLDAALAERKAPLGVQICGSSSVMKTSFVQIVETVFCKVNNIPNKPQYKYTRIFGDKHWNNFRSYKPIIRCDDVASFKDGGTHEFDESLKEFLQMLNNANFIPPQAAIDDKGMTPFLGALCTFTTNTPRMNLDAVYSCPLAAARRMRIVVDLIPKDKYRKSGNGYHFMDPLKVPTVTSEEFLDIWHIRAYEVVPVGSKEGIVPENFGSGSDPRTHMTFRYNFLKQYDSVYDFLDYFVRVIHEHNKIQDKYMTMVNSYENYQGCGKCFRPKDKCRCKIPRLTQQADTPQSGVPPPQAGAPPLQSGIPPPQIPLRAMPNAVRLSWTEWVWGFMPIFTLYLSLWFWKFCPFVPQTVRKLKLGETMTCIPTMRDDGYRLLADGAVQHMMGNDYYRLYIRITAYLGPLLKWTAIAGGTYLATTAVINTFKPREKEVQKSEPNAPVVVNVHVPKAEANAVPEQAPVKVPIPEPKHAQEVDWIMNNGRNVVTGEIIGKQLKWVPVDNPSICYCSTCNNTKAGIVYKHHKNPHFNCSCRLCHKFFLENPEKQLMFSVPRQCKTTGCSCGCCALIHDQQKDCICIYCAPGHPREFSPWRDVAAWKQYVADMCMQPKMDAELVKKERFILGQQIDLCDIDRALQAIKPLPDIHQRKEVWKKPTYDLSPIELGTRTTSWAQMDQATVLAHLSQNLGRINVLKSERIVSRNSVLFIQSHIALTTKHAFKDFPVEIEICFSTKAINVNHSMMLYEKDLHLVGEDVVLFWYPHTPPMKDFVELLTNVPCQGLFKTVLTRLDVDYQLDLSYATTMYDRVADLNRAEYEYMAYKCMFEKETRKGDCGSPLMWFSHKGPILLGVHALGNNRIGSSSFVNRDIVKDKIKLVLPFSSFDKGTLFTLDNQALIEVHSKAPVNFVEGGRAVVFGTVPKRVVRPKTNIVFSLLHKPLCDRGFNTSFEIPRDLHTWKPWHIGIVKRLGKEDPYFEAREYKLAAESYLDKIKDVKFDPYIADMHTAINGADGVAHINPLDFNTSTGYPYNVGKKKMCHGEPGNRVFDQVIMDEIARVITCYTERRRYNPVFTGAVKDEVVSALKNEIGKYRVFMGSPVAWAVVVRMAFLWVVKPIQENGFLFEVAAGMNHTSPLWQVFYDYLMQHDGNIIAGDYGGFDTNDDVLVAWYAFYILIETGKKHGASPIHILLMEGVASDVIYNVSIFWCVLIMLFGCTVSGFPLTLIFNSLKNSLYMRCAYLNINPAKECLTFNQFVSLMTLGDDNAMGVSREIPWFNHTSIAQVLSSVGVEYTMAEKDADSVPYISISETTFVKRTFRYDEDFGCIVCPIAEESIFKSLHFRDLKSPLSSEDHALTVLAGSLREKAYYGRSFFEEWKTIVWGMIKELQLEEMASGHNISTITFDGLVSSWWDDWHGVEYAKNLDWYKEPIRPGHVAEVGKTKNANSSAVTAVTYLGLYESDREWVDEVESPGRSPKSDTNSEVIGCSTTVSPNLTSTELDALGENN
jgi:hypothetical protein